LGHAIELLALERDVDELRHGEAVAIGLAFAVRLAHALGRVDVSDIVNHDEVLQTLGLGQSLPQGMQIADIVSAMGHDNKAHHDLTFVLPGPDGFETVRDIDRAMVEKVLENFRGGQ
jgi:3-dehydroquinate synthetase